MVYKIMFSQKKMKLPQWVLNAFTHWRGILASALVALLTPLLLLSETTYKGILEGWFQECRIVIEKTVEDGVDENGDKIVHVELYPTDKTPKKVTVVFSTKNKIIKRVLFERKMSENKLIVHPLAGQSCPGGSLCSESENIRDLNSDIRVMLSDFYHNFRYLFAVTVKSDKSPGIFTYNDLDVYVHFNKTISKQETPVCRVEAASFFNLYFRSGEWMRFWMTSAIVISLIMLVTILKSKG